MKRGVIYARYSCDKQSDNSTKAQIRECEAWAKNNGIKIVDHYLDEAISGRTDKRPGFQKMIKDAKAQLFDCIIVWKGDRFSRSRADAAKYKTMLKHLGIRVLSATEANLEGPEAVLMDGINESFAEYYSVELSAKVTRGMKQNIIDGKFNGGPIAFGYILNKETRRMEIDPDKAEVVRQIFSQYVYEGMNPNQIQKYWEARGYKLPSRTAVMKFLRNEKYIGIWRYQDVVNKTCYPPIVDEELFHQAQEKIKENYTLGSRHKKPNEPFLLLGKAYCGNCNTLFIAKSGTARSGQQIRYYTCPNHHKGGCSIKGIKKEDLEETVMNTVVQIIKDGNERKKMIQTILDLQKETSPQLGKLEVKIASKTTQIDNLTTAIAMGGNIPELVAMINKCKQEKDELEANYIHEQKKARVLTSEQLELFFDNLAEVDITDVRKRVILVSAFDNSVIVHDEGLTEILMNYRGDNGVFLKSSVVRLQATEVHHCPRLTNPYLVNQYVIGVRCSTKDGQVLPWIDR